MDTKFPENNQDIDPIQRDVSKILEYKNKGCLFHGSTKNDIEVLKPRQATDTDPKNTFNNDCAVFASTLPDACIFGLLCTNTVPENLLNGSFQIVVGANLEGHLEAEIPLIWKPYMEENTGTLYILPSDSFKEKSPGWQVKSKGSVRPIDRISVGFEHFEKLGGKVVWVDTLKKKEG